MDPITFSLIGSAIGSGVGKAFGGYIQGSAQADTMQQNARIAEQNARIVEGQTNLQEGLQRKRAGQILGAQRASIAQSGFEDSGTMQDIARQSGAAAELDAMNIRFEGALKAKNLRDQAAQDRFGAKQVKRAAGIGAFAGLLQTGAAAYGSYQSAGGGVPAAAGAA